MQGINRRFYYTIVPKAVGDVNHKSAFEGLFQIRSGKLEFFDFRRSKSEGWKKV